MTRKLMAYILHTRLAITAWRIALLYVAMQLCRAVFYLYNADLVGDISSDEVGELLRGALLFDNASIIYSMLLFLLLSALPLPHKLWQSRGWQRVMFWSYIVPAMVMLAANMGDVVYFHYTEKRCTADEIFFADNGNTLELMLQFMWENLHLVLLWLFMVVALVWAYRRRFAVVAARMTLVEALLRIAMLLLVVLYAIVGIRGGITRMTRPITLSNSMLYADTPTKANMILSNPFCIIRTISNKVDVPHFFEAAEVEQIYTPIHNPSAYRSEMFGRYEGYNVVLVILESFSAEHSALLLAEEHDGNGYTPHIDSLMRRGLCFERCYANGQTSITAPPAIWSSTPSYQTPFILMSESVAECRPLPRLLADKGYHTAFFCGSERGSMGFGAYAHIAGVDRLYSMEEYAERYSMDDFDGKWGIWDEPFLNYMGEELDSFPEPFFATLFTLTSHHPFNTPEEVRDELPAGTTLNHRPVAYTDRAIGRFMERYGQRGWFRRTLFVFIADHVSSERMAERTLYNPGNHHIVGFAYTADGSLQQSYDHIFSQVDVMPTILGLVGNEEPYFAIGRDIFNEPDRVPFTLIRSGYGYIALTDEYVIEFDGHSCVGAYCYDDIYHTQNILSEIDIEPVENLIKATLQQYYQRVSDMNYLP